MQFSSAVAWLQEGNFELAAKQLFGLHHPGILDLLAQNPPVCLALARRYGELWRVKDAERMTTISPLRPAKHLGFRPDGRLFEGTPSLSDDWSLFSPGWRYYIQSAPEGVAVYETETGARQCLLPTNDPPMAISPDGSLVAIRSGERSFEIWSVAIATPIETIEASAYIHGLEFSPNGKMLASNQEVDREGHCYGVLEIWQQHERKFRQVRRFEMPENVTRARWSPDGRYLGVACTEVGLRIWDAASLVHICDLGDPNATDLAFSPDGTLVAEARCVAPTARVWSLSGDNPGFGSCVQILNCQHPADGDADGGGSVGSWELAFSLDGRSLAVQHEDHTIKVWHIR
jgi:WD40 repeat protein